MANELAAEGLPRPVRIFGVNVIGQDASNAFVCAGRTLPWLQDEAGQEAWQSWGVSRGDIVVLDASNERRTSTNVLLELLEDAVSYEDLKGTLRALASAP